MKSFLFEFVLIIQDKLMACKGVFFEEVEIAREYRKSASVHSAFYITLCKFEKFTEFGEIKRQRDR